MNYTQFMKNQNRQQHIASLIKKIRKLQTKGGTFSIVRSGIILRNLLATWLKSDPSCEAEDNFITGKSLVDELTAAGYNLDSKIKPIDSPDTEEKTKERKPKKKAKPPSKKKASKRPWLVFSAFESSRRRH